MTQPRREFLGLRFDPLPLDAALAAIAARPAGNGFAYVVTPNVDHVVRLERRPDLRPLYDRALLCLCDSRILGALACHYGVDLPLAPGSDLTARIFADVLREGDRIAIVGGEGDLVARLGALHPGLDIRQHRPPMGLARDAAALADAARFVAEARARFTFLAVGSPQQELLALAIADRGDATGIGLCIGASIDFLLGDRRRAPRWVQRAGLEWAHRLSGEPRRLARRYLVEGPRIFLIARRWARRRPA